jgi:hypothetical protein
MVSRPQDVCKWLTFHPWKLSLAQHVQKELAIHYLPEALEKHLVSPLTAKKQKRKISLNFPKSRSSNVFPAQKTSAKILKFKLSRLVFKTL